MSQERLGGRFERLLHQLEELLGRCDDPLAHRATAVALLHHKVPGASWTGFYMLRHGQLVVDVYQGPVACQVLAAHTGVCWAGIDRRETVVVADVHSFPGHIPCDPGSRSEIVVPVSDGAGEPIGVLDVDSHRPANFGEEHARGYEAIVRSLERRWQELAVRP